MKHLAKRRDIIIITAEKGGAVVILETENYIKEANRQLSDKNIYNTLQTDPTLQHNKMVNDTLDRFKNESLLSKKNCRRTECNKSKDTKTFILHPKYKKKIIQGDLSSTQSTVLPLKFHNLLTITFNL